MSVEPPLPSPEIENLHGGSRGSSRRIPAFAAQANATADLYAEAEADFEAFWAKRARERIDWSKPFEKTLEWDLPFAKWFTGGELNVAYNCVDRHVERGLGDKVAYHWIGEPGDTRTLTFRDLQREVSKAANALKELGVKTGDRVAIYMPMIPELPIAMLACARIGAPHTVVFGGFSAEALSGRINDCGAKVLITADGGYRRGKEVGLKHHADEALASTPTIEAAIVVKRLGHDVHMTPDRDIWWHDIVDRQSEDCPPVPVESRAHALPALHVGHDRQAEGHPAHDRRLPARHVVHPLGDLRRQARRRVLVRRRHRLGDRPQLHRLRPAGQRDDRGHVRGRAGHAGLGPLVADRRGLQGLDPVLRPDRHPGVHEAGRGVAGEARPVVAAGPRLGRRADQPRGLALVPRAHRRQQGAGRRHLVADRDGPDHDHAAPRRDRHEAGFGDVPVPGHRRRRRRRRRQRRCRSVVAAISSSSGRGRRCCAASTATRIATSETYWSRFPGMYFAGDGAKRDEDGYLWLLGPGRRRHERGRPPDLHDRGRVRPGRPQVRRRGRGRRQEGRRLRPGDLRLRHPQGRPASRPTPLPSSCASTSPTSSARSPARSS